jgi:cytosine/adenosine deaminase-related metal-dependent hydrolase
VARRAALLAGAWKNLFAGVTTVVHHDAWEADFDHGFPIRVARVPSADSLGMSERVQAPSAGPFCLHVAEGTDEVARGELDALQRRGLLNQWLIAVHGVGLIGSAIERFRRSGAALVWCPTSNHFLFGRTASKDLLDGGSDILLGSDSLLTGAGDLLDEIRAARASRLVDDQRLDESVGRTAARRLGLAEPSLEPRARADLILLRSALGESSSKDVALTIVAGVPRVASADIARQLGAIAEHGTSMRVGGSERWANQQGEKHS